MVFHESPCDLPFEQLVLANVSLFLGAFGGLLNVWGVHLTPLFCFLVQFLDEFGQWCGKQDVIIHKQFLVFFVELVDFFD